MGQAQSPPAHDKIALPQFLVIGAQLALLALVIRQFEVESNAFLRVALLAFAGFALHAFLPLRYADASQDRRDREPDVLEDELAQRGAPDAHLFEALTDVESLRIPLACSRSCSIAPTWLANKHVRSQSMASTRALVPSLGRSLANSRPSPTTSRT